MHENAGKAVEEEIHHGEKPPSKSIHANSHKRACQAGWRVAHDEQKGDSPVA
jgi:hypothetical protein